MEYTEGSRVLASRARLAVLSAWAVIAMTIAMLAAELGEVVGVIDLTTPTDAGALVFAVIGGGYTLAFVVSVVMVSMWIYRAHGHLRDADMQGLEFTPGWAVGWYFIPFANLIKPFQAMRELWNASLGNSHSFSEPASDQVKWWWGTWIVGNIVSNISTRMSLAGDPDLLFASALLGAFSSVAIIACAWLLIGLIRDISNGLDSGFAAAHVFA